MLKTKLGKSVLLICALCVFGLYQNCSGGLQGMNDGSSSILATGVDDGGAARLSAAKAVFTAKCISCHNGSTASNFNLNSDQDFIAAGLVVPGSLSSSKIIYRLKNSPSTNGLNTMPTSGSLTDAEYSIVTNWVSSIGQTSGQQAANAFTCNANEAPDTLDAKRLSRQQIYNSLSALLSRPFGVTTALSILTTADVMNRLPADGASPYTSADASFTALHAQAFFDIADLIAKASVTSANYPKFVATYIGYAPGTCTYTDPTVLNQACRDVLIKNFLLRAWGRPADATTLNANNEVAAFQTEFSLAANTSAGVENMIYRALLAPEFLFHLQIDVAATGTSYRLSSYQIARRLAYLYTQAPPDETLLAMAGAKDLFDETAFAEAIVYVSQRLDPTLQTFTREWLGLNSLPGYKNTTHPKFALITQGITADETLKSAMSQEVVDLVSYVTANKRPVSEMFTSNISFARNPSLMKIYGQSTAAPATVTEANAVRFPAGERSGLLTRAAMLFSGGESENPILRGVHIRKQIFCLTVGSPPPGIGGLIATPVADPTLTTRDRYRIKTSAAACIGCHAQINPVGFAFSKYNAFGALQLNEPIYDASTPPQLSKYLPTDSSTSLQDGLGINATVADGVELSALASTSSQFKKCFTQNFYTYTQGLSNLPSDVNSCAMNRMYQSLDSGGTLQDFFKSTALDSRFKFRTIKK